MSADHFCGDDCPPRCPDETPAAALIDAYEDEVSTLPLSEARRVVANLARAGWVLRRADDPRAVVPPF